MVRVRTVARLPRFAILARALAIACLLVVPASKASGQAAAPAAADDRLRVFLDCQAPYCDYDYFRTEITFVDYVRDRRDARLHLLITAQRTGGGGWEFTLAFLGLGTLAGQDQTLRYVSSGDATDDEVREGLARHIKVGLVRYVAGTPIADRLRISLNVSADSAAETTTPTAADDPWNLWSFRVGVNGGMNGERASRSARMSGNISANRITEMWKIEIFSRGSYNESAFEVPLDDSTIFKSTNYQHSHFSEALIVRSIGNRWATGAQLSVRGSTRENQRLTVQLAPAVEANYFPYSESTRRQLTARYTVGATSYQYRDTTIYFKMDEVIPEHSLLVAYSATQPWGSVFTSLQASQALNNPDFYRFTAGGFGEFRLFRGFNLTLSGNYARINDQTFLPKSGATVEEVLLRQRQLATSYQYGFSVGLSYRFGSILQNVVNPRFSSGEMFFFF